MTDGKSPKELGRIAITDGGIRMYHRYYCTSCQEIVGLHPKQHRDEEHEGSLTVDVIPISDKDTDGRWIAKPNDMGHYSPHVWMDVDGQEMCGECGGVRIAEDVVERHIEAEAES